MKNIKYFLLLFVLPLLVSCFDDMSSCATKPLSHITIEAGVDSVYNLEKNDTLEITPIVSQANTPKTLKYTWEIEQEVYSTESSLTYVGVKLGVFNARLIIENEDGKTFFPFTINVNSPYEEGLTVLSKDANGTPMLAFMRTPYNKDEKGEFYDYDCFSKNNEGLEFASYPVDIVHTTGSIVIACQGSETAGDSPTIYFLNEKTFVLENIIESSEYADFKPTKLMIPSKSVAGVSYHLLSADGKMYSLPVYNAVLQPSTKLFSTYSQACFVENDGSDSEFDIVFWDKVNKNVALMYNGYGPYYYGDKYLLTPTDSVFPTDNYFESIKSFVTLTGIRRTKEQVKTSEREMLVLVKSKVDVQKLVIATFPWRGIEGKPGQYKIHDNGGFKLAGTSSPIDENTPCVANKTYQSLLFAKGNKVRRWYYNSTKHINKADEFDLGLSETAVVTAIEISDDHHKTYVGFYDSAENHPEGKNGSVWVINTDTGEVLEKYNNICYRPVKVIYKKK